jgi:hypothetical protein
MGLSTDKGHLSAHKLLQVADKSSMIPFLDLGFEICIYSLSYDSVVIGLRVGDSRVAGLEAASLRVEGRVIVGP